MCLKADTGKEIWRKSLTGDFGGRSGGWNYTESPMVDEGKVIVTPGGRKGAVVALNKKTGELVESKQERIHSLSLVPSPYTTGLLDEFFDGFLTDLIIADETNSAVPECI